MHGAAAVRRRRLERVHHQLLLHPAEERHARLDALHEEVHAHALAVLALTQPLQLLAERVRVAAAHVLRELSTLYSNRSLQTHAPLGLENRVSCQVGLPAWLLLLTGGRVHAHVQVRVFSSP